MIPLRKLGVLLLLASMTALVVCLFVCQDARDRVKAQGALSAILILFLVLAAFRGDDERGP